jgi:hypothetical protein
MRETIWETKGVVLRYTGAITSSEMNFAAERVQASAKFDSIQFAIHDLSACESLTNDPTDLTTMVARASSAVRRHKVIAVAFVGTIRALHEAFSHIKSVDIYGREMGLFDSVAEARAFIAKVTGIDTEA